MIRLRVSGDRTTLWLADLAAIWITLPTVAFVALCVLEEASEAPLLAILPDEASDRVFALHAATILGVQASTILTGLMLVAAARGHGWPLWKKLAALLCCFAPGGPLIAYLSVGRRWVRESLAGSPDQVTPNAG